MQWTTGSTHRAHHKDVDARDTGRGTSKAHGRAPGPSNVRMASRREDGTASNLIVLQVHNEGGQANHEMGCEWQSTARLRVPRNSTLAGMDPSKRAPLGGEGREGRCQRRPWRD